MARRVTIQDIADELGISRNTVSKAINNTGILADTTRERVLKKAIEMGYKQFSYVNIPGLGRPDAVLAPTVSKGEISLFTSRFIGDSHFASMMLDNFQREVSSLGYSFTMHRVQKDEIKNLVMPASYDKSKSVGIICVEMFDKKYCSMLCELDTPVLFVDSPAYGIDEPLKADILLMDNRSGIYKFVNEMVRRGKKRIGFIGECFHCQSFFERFMGYRNAMYLLGLPCSEEFCIIGNTKHPQNMGCEEYRIYLKRQFKKLSTLPDVFICANDFVAIDVLRVFKELGILVPQDVYLCGFDNSPESRLVTPSLTTIHIHSQIMGFSAANLLLSRIKEPSLNFRVIYTETSLIYRESTENY